MTPRMPYEYTHECPCSCMHVAFLSYGTSAVYAPSRKPSKMAGKASCSPAQAPLPHHCHMPAWGGLHACEDATGASLPPSPPLAGCGSTHLHGHTARLQSLLRAAPQEEEAGRVGYAQLKAAPMQQQWLLMGSPGCSCPASPATTIARPHMGNKFSHPRLHWPHVCTGPVALGCTHASNPWTHMMPICTLGVLALAARDRPVMAPS